MFMNIFKKNKNYNAKSLLTNQSYKIAKNICDFVSKDLYEEKYDQIYFSMLTEDYILSSIKEKIKELSTEEDIIEYQNKTKNIDDFIIYINLTKEKIIEAYTTIINKHKLQRQKFNDELKKSNIIILHKRRLKNDKGDIVEVNKKRYYLTDMTPPFFNPDRNEFIIDMADNNFIIKHENDDYIYFYKNN